MRLIRAAIFASALLSGLLNIKRFVLQGDTGEWWSQMWGGGGGLIHILPSLHDPGKPENTPCHSQTWMLIPPPWGL